MTPEASVQHTFTAPAHVRGRLSDRLVAAISLLAALLLILALTGPGTFLIAKKATDATRGTQYSSLLASDQELILTVSTGQSADYSPDRIASSAGQDTDKESSPGPKRPRGVLLKTEVSKVFALIVPSEVLGPRIEEGSSKNEPVFIEAPPKNKTIPQELLRRPPPE